MSLELELSALALLFVLLAAAVFARKPRLTKDKGKLVSVNYHFLRTCNYSCKFCFHTNTNDNILPIEQIKRGLTMLADKGLVKINFAGGEPFLQPKVLGQMVQFCKEDLGVSSVSIVSNGSKITDRWLKQYGQYVDIIALSCDSFDEEVNKKIGRGNGNHVKGVQNAAKLLKKYNIKFKLNTVVCSLNYGEDMSNEITKLEPFRWKVFQVLPIDGENRGTNAKRNVENLLISSDQFNSFKKIHSSISCMVPEDNTLMQNSYLLLDEEMRFLNCSSGSKAPSKSILEAGVVEALKEAGFNEAQFYERGGDYADQWTRDLSLTFVDDDPSCDSCPGGGELPEHLQF